MRVGEREHTSNMGSRPACTKKDLIRSLNSSFSGDDTRQFTRAMQHACN